MELRAGVRTQERSASGPESRSSVDESKSPRKMARQSAEGARPTASEPVGAVIGSGTPRSTVGSPNIDGPLHRNTERQSVAAGRRDALSKGRACSRPWASDQWSGGMPSRKIVRQPDIGPLAPVICHPCRVTRIHPRFTKASRGLAATIVSGSEDFAP